MAAQQRHFLLILFWITTCYVTGPTEAGRNPTVLSPKSLNPTKLLRRTYRIAVVAPLFESVPPKQHTGLPEERTAQIVHDLVEELVKRGHEVTLFAPHGSKTSATLISHEDYPAMGKQRAIPGFWNNRYLWMFEQLRARFDQFDLIHFHCIEHFAHMDKFMAKALTTLYEQPGGGTIADLSPIAHLFPKANVVVSPEDYFDAMKHWRKMAGIVPLKGMTPDALADAYEAIYTKIVPMLQTKNGSHLNGVMNLVNGYGNGYSNGYSNENVAVPGSGEYQRSATNGYYANGITVPNESHRIESNGFLSNGLTVPNGNYRTESNGSDRVNTVGIKRKDHRNGLHRNDSFGNGIQRNGRNGFHRSDSFGRSIARGFESPNHFIEMQRSSGDNWSVEQTPNAYYSPRSQRFRQLRIAIVSPPILDVLPPKKGGGTERMVYFLASELTKRGHHVTLFAPMGTKTRAHLLPIPYRTDPWAGKGNWAHHMLPVIFSQEFVKRTAHQFDIVHFHDTDHYVLMREFLKCTLTTRHMPVNDPTFFKMFSHVPMVSISDEQRKHVPEGLSMNWAGTVHNGIPVDNFTFSPKADTKEPYLAWMGRMTPFKGIEMAIAFAVRAGVRLKIAAQIVDEHREWWEETVVPLIKKHSPLVQYIGEVGCEKDIFLGNALAFLFTPMWDEPFGLSLVEAMATGTPAIANRRGAVPEIVDEGVTGFMFDYDENSKDAEAQIEQLVGRGLIEKAAKLDRARIRETVKRRWSLEQMAYHYEQVYHEVLATKC